MFKSFKSAVLLLIIFFSFSENSLSASPSNVENNITIGEKFIIESSVLNEKREYWVSLPRSYNKNNNKKYPVLYMFDAELNALFHVFSGMVKQMGIDATPTIPEMIVVGIVNKNRVKDSSPTNSLIQYGGSENKSYKVSGGADTYLQFIEKELIPTIESNFKTTNYRILTGYSFTGPTVIHSLYSKPELFNAYISIDPSMWWDNQVMIKRYDNFQKNIKLHKRRLFIAGSERLPSVFPDENYVIEFINLINSKPTDNLAFGSVIFSPEENHNTMQIMSFYKGLRYIFDGFMVRQDVSFHPAADLKQQFVNLSKKLGFEFHLSEGLINWYGYGRLYNSQFGIDVNRAIEFFILNTEYYPESSNAWDSLGEAYGIAGEKEQSLQAYKKSFALDPKNENAVKQIKLLESR